MNNSRFGQAVALGAAGVFVAAVVLLGGAPSAVAQVTTIPGEASLGAPLSGPGDGFCGQFTRARDGDFGGPHRVTDLSRAITILNDTTGPPHRHDPDMTFYALVPVADFHNGLDDTTGGELDYNNLFPWSDPDALWSESACESHGGGAVGSRRFAMRLRGDLHVESPGVWTFGFRTDDGFRFTLGGQNIGEFNGEREPGVDTFRVSFEEAGVYPIEVIYYQNLGTAVFEMLYAPEEIAFQSATSSTRDPDGVNLVDADVDVLGAPFGVVNSSIVFLPSWTPDFVPPAHSDCSEFVGQPSDICVIDDADAVCGNGVINQFPDGTVQECDDGNRVDGDGCDANCQIEDGWLCMGQPSVCERADGDGDSDGDSDGDINVPVTVHYPVDGGITNNDRPTFSGTAPPGSEIEIWVDGELIGTTTADEDGNWSFTPEEPLEEGERDVVIVIRTPDGREFRTERTFEIDRDFVSDDGSEWSHAPDHTELRSRMVTGGGYFCGAAPGAAGSSSALVTMLLALLGLGVLRRRNSSRRANV